MIPGHGEPSDNVTSAINATQDYIRTVMGHVVDDFVSCDEAYRNADWSAHRDMPAFDASHRGNAYRIYLELEAGSLR